MNKINALIYSTRTSVNVNELNSYNVRAFKSDTAMHTFLNKGDNANKFREVDADMQAAGITKSGTYFFTYDPVMGKRYIKI
jgi:hypothetical protein